MFLKRRKKKRTGNNTANRQYLYLLMNVPLFFLFKIGVTGDMANRKREIDETTIGKTVVLFAGRIWAAYYIEQFLLGITFPFRFSLNGSGGSEWRLLGILVLPLMWICLLIDRFWYVFVLTALCWWEFGRGFLPLEKIVTILF